MLLAHRFGLSSSDVETGAQRPLFHTAERLSGQAQQLFGVVFLQGSAGIVEGFQFVAGGFGILHTGKQRIDAGIISPPEVVGN
jgi:hypothetical protein